MKIVSAWNAPVIFILCAAIAAFFSGCGGNEGITDISGDNAADGITTGGTSGDTTGGDTGGTTGGDTGGSTGGDTGGTTGGDTGGDTGGTTGGDTGGTVTFNKTTVTFNVFELQETDILLPVQNASIYVDGELAGLTGSSGTLSASVNANPDALVTIDSSLYVTSDMNYDLTVLSELYLFIQPIDSNITTLPATVQQKSFKGANVTITDLSGTAKVTVSDWDLSYAITVKVTPYLSSNIPPQLKDASSGLTGYPIMGADLSCRLASNNSKIDMEDAGFSGKVYPEIRSSFPEFKLENIMQMLQDGAVTVSLWYLGYDETQTDPVKYRKWTKAGNGTMQYVESSATYLIKTGSETYMPGLFPFVFVLDYNQAPEVTVTGTVQDQNGPVADCFVLAENSQTKTDSSGNFTITALLPSDTNKLFLTAVKTGYENESIYITLSQGTTQYTASLTIQTTADAAQPVTTITITGNVTNFYDSQPIENAGITLWSDTAVIGDTSGTISSKTGNNLSKLTISAELPRTVSVDYLEGVTYTWEFKNTSETSWHTMLSGAGTSYTSMTETDISDAVNAEIAGGYQYYSGKYDLRVTALHSNGMTEEATGYFTTLVDDAILGTPSWLANSTNATAKGGSSKGFYSASPAQYDDGTTYSVEWYVKAYGTYNGTLTTILDKKIAAAEFIYASQLGYFLSENFDSMTTKYDSNGDSVADTSYMTTGINITIYAIVDYTFNGTQSSTIVDVENTLLQMNPNQTLLLLDVLDISPFFAGPFSATDTIYTDANGDFGATVNAYYDGYIKMQVTATDFYDSGTINLMPAVSGTVTIDVILYSFPFVTGEIEIMAGTPGQAGSKDGTGQDAWFNSPQGITGDGYYLYVCDTGNFTIRRINLATKEVKTVAGTLGTSGHVDATGTFARFENPQGIAYGNGYCFISDLPYFCRKLNVNTLEVTSPVFDLVESTLLPTVQKAIATNGTFYYPVVAQRIEQRSVTTDGINMSDYVCAPDDVVTSLISIGSHLYAVINGKLYVYDGSLERGYLNIDNISSLTSSNNTHIIAFDESNFKRFHLNSLTTYEYPKTVGVSDIYYYNDAIYATLDNHTVVKIPLAKNIISSSEQTAPDAEAELAPFIIGTYDSEDEAYGVTVDSGLAYISDYADGMYAVDLTDLRLLDEVSGVDIENMFLWSDIDPPLMGYALSTGISGNTAFIASEIGELYIVDLTANLLPVDSADLGQSEFIGQFVTPGMDYRMKISGNYAYLTNWDIGLQIVDISDPMALSIAGTCNTPAFAYGIDVAGNYAYVADGYFGGLQVIDVSNPTVPVITGSYVTAGESAISVAVSGNYAYLTNLLSGMQVINISNPALPSLTAELDTPGYAYNVAIFGNYAHIADGPGSGLLVIDITDPSAPEIIGSCVTGGYAHDVFIVNNHAFVADGEPGMHSIGGIRKVSWP